MLNQHVGVFDAVENDILAYGEAAYPWLQVVIAVAAEVRVEREQVKTFGKRAYEMLCNIGAAALSGDVVPDAVKLVFRFR